jgi:quercetin dioxygenase-like cupin family protein
VTSALRSALTLAGAAGALLAPAHVAAQATHAAAKAHANGKSATAKLKWGPAPAVFRPGARLAVVRGDPSQSGEYVVQLAMPSGYRIAPHYHPTDEHVKVVRGRFLVGLGDTLDLAKTKRLGVGDTITAPANMHHYAATRGRTVVEVSGMGPFQLTYVNPADMPKAGAKAQP